MKKRHYLLSLTLAALLSLTCLVGCSNSQEAADVPAATEEAAAITVEEVADESIATGGILCLKVNPEIAVHYDENGLVTKLEARNNDAKAIIEKCNDYVGKETHTVVKELVTAIGNAGYFVEEVEGVGKRITIEIEVGSVLPNDTFVDNVVAEVKDYVSSNNYRNYIELEGNTDYGITDYNDTDYGPNNDGITDYNLTDYGVAPAQTSAPATAAPTPAAEPVPTPKAESTPAPAPAPTATPTPQAVTDYHITDYGVTNYDDHVTDYGNTNYDDHVTDYGNTNYDDHVTDYGNTNYDDHVTDYGNTNYDKDSGYDD